MIDATTIRYRIACFSDVKHDKTGAVIAGLVMFFPLFAGYSMLPVCETMDSTGGVANLRGGIETLPGRPQQPQLVRLFA